MRLTILGNNGPFPAAGGACSGYLLRDGNTRILIDCGNGVLGNLQKFTSFEELDAVILTHLHSDHISDMMVLRYAIQVKKNRGLYDRELAVYAPQEPVDEYNRLNLPGTFQLKPVNPELVLGFGGLKLTFREVKHPYKCYAVAIEKEGKRFVFSGDTSWTESIIEFSRGADVAMLDAGLLARDKTSENVPHLTAAECGIIAREAGVKRLLLTHFWSEYNKNELLEEAKKHFENTELTEMLCTYEI